MCKLANGRSRGLSRHRIKWHVSWNCRKVILVTELEGAFDSVKTKIRRGWCNFRDSVSLFALLTKRQIILCMCALRYAIWKWDLDCYRGRSIRLERNNGRMVRLICKVRRDYWISAEELKTRQKLKSMWDCLQDRRLHMWGLHQLFFCEFCETFL